MEKRNACKILVGEPEGKAPLGRPNTGGWIIIRWTLEDSVVWNDLAQDRDCQKTLVKQLHT
jgi:hypothetical protein